MSVRIPLRVLAVAGAFLLAAGLAQAADFPMGTFTSKIADNSWALHFKEKGKAIVTLNDKEVVEGTYKVEKDEVHFTSEKGELAAPNLGPGKYKWKLEDKKKLTFTKVEDPSEGRATVLTTQAWTKKE